MDEGKARQQQTRGERAARILKDSLVAEAFDGIRAELIEQWENGDGPEIREEAHRLLCALKLFRSRFEHWVRTGRGATNDLEKLHKD